MARAYARTHGLNVSIIWCCNNYGPDQFPEEIIPLFVTNLLDGLEAALWRRRQRPRLDSRRRSLPGIQLSSSRAPRPGRITSTATRELTQLEPTRAILEHCSAGWHGDPGEDRKGDDWRYSLDESAAGLGDAPRIRSLTA